MTAFFLDEDQTDVPPGLTAAVNRLLADPSASNAGEICAEIADIVTNAHPSVREIEIHADDLGEKFMMTVGLPELPEESGEKKTKPTRKTQPSSPEECRHIHTAVQGQRARTEQRVSEINRPHRGAKRRADRAEKSRTSDQVARPIRAERGQSGKNPK